MYLKKQQKLLNSIGRGLILKKLKHSDSSDQLELTKAEKRSLKKEKKKIRKQEYQRRDLLKITSNGN